MREERASLKGWLVVNAFTHSHKFDELYDQLHIAAAMQGVELVQKDTIEVSSIVASGTLHRSKPSFVLFWDKDISLCKALEIAGCRCLNSSYAIATCDNKAQTYLAMLKEGIAQPKTMLTPKVFRSVNWNDTEYPRLVERELGLPVVIKECYGSFGAQVHLAHSVCEIAAILNEIGPRPSLCQEFIATSVGRDVRLQVVGGRVVAAMQRVSAGDDFRANLTNGGVAQAWNPTPEQEELALSVCASIGLDFAGVDLLFGVDNKPVLCEVNSNAHFVNLREITDVDTASHIIAHAVEISRKALRTGKAE